MSAPQLSLADRTSRGVAWLSGQAVIAKLAGLAGQIVLARLLLREDFGLYGLASTVYTLAAMFHQAGVQEVLIQRQRSFRLWANTAFWISMTTSLVAMALMAALVPLAVAIYRPADPRALVRLILILSLNLPIGAAGAVPRARLQSDLRFRAFAVIAVIHVVLDVALKIAFAAWGFGADAFAIGAISASTVYLVLSWKVAPVRVRFQPELRRWKYLFGNGMLVTLAAFFYWIVEEADYLILGCFEDVSVVGLYFFAYKISRQSMSLFTLQVAKALFPALSRLVGERSVPVQPFIRATSMLFLLVLPVCALQSWLADPLVRLVFTHRWYPAIPLIQWICIGMAFRSLSGPAGSFLQAQGRFRVRLVVTACAAVLFVLSATVGTWLGSALGLAMAITAVYFLISMVDIAVAVRPGQAIWCSVRSIYLIPITLTAASWAMAHFGYLMLNPIVPQNGTDGLVAELFLKSVLFIGTYLVTLRLVAPQPWNELRSRFARLIFSPQRVSEPT